MLLFGIFPINLKFWATIHLNLSIAAKAHIFRSADNIFFNHMIANYEDLLFRVLLILRCKTLNCKIIQLVKLCSYETPFLFPLNKQNCNNFIVEKSKKTNNNYKKIIRRKNQIGSLIAYSIRIRHWHTSLFLNSKKSLQKFYATSNLCSQEVGNNFWMEIL